MERFFGKIRLYANSFGRVFKSLDDETSLLALGAVLSKQQLLLNSENLNDYEFKIFSQWGEDGIIQYLIRNVPIKNEVFIEFGVEDYTESNTRFLMMNNNWTGFIMDGSEKAMKSVEQRRWFWKYNLQKKSIFITKENINPVLSSTGLKDIGLLSIDIDGNDYHIFKEIDLSELNPSVIILEYNSIFGKERKITVPYDSEFVRSKKHYSNLYFGASLGALSDLASLKGYALVGCNIAGNNAFFVRKDLLSTKIKEVLVSQAFRMSNFRESRDKNGQLSFLSGQDRIKLLKGLPVLNIETNTVEYL